MLLWNPSQGAVTDTPRGEPDLVGVPDVAGDHVGELDGPVPQGEFPSVRPPTQSLGLRPFDPMAIPAADPSTAAGIRKVPSCRPSRRNPSATAGDQGHSRSPGSAVWEDDLIMTGVRSFDIKAYDDVFAGYVDLGWGDDLRLYQPYYPTGGGIGSPPPAPRTYGRRI